MRPSWPCGDDGCGEVHSDGVLDPASPDFHGRLVAQVGWDLSTCARCHGEDFRGGAAGVPCTTCHAAPGGPAACSTCHDEAPGSGAHAVHTPFGCAACHRVPDRWDAPGHVLADTPPADVTFGDLAAATPPGTMRAGAPSYDAASGACANVHCHGDTLADAAARTTRPTWNGGPSQAECGACHGAPPATHAAGYDGCGVCHPVDRHVDGVIDVGRVPGSGCRACHTEDEGAHASHIAAPRRLRGPIDCTTCHPTPYTVDAPGHLDTAPPAEVILTLGTWDRMARTCVSWCHGEARPAWDAVGEGAASCGTCHGIPPAGTHAPSLGLRDCATCHPRTVDGYGNLVVGPAGSEHIDGDVDL